jgi:hypothetical protein
VDGIGGIVGGGGGGSGRSGSGRAQREVGRNVDFVEHACQKPFFRSYCFFFC